MKKYSKELYKKYLAQFNGYGFDELMNEETFFKMLEEKLDNLEYVEIQEDNKVGVLYFDVYKEKDYQVCDVPVFGYYASDIRTLSEVFTIMADKVLKNGKTLFRMHVYANDNPSKSTFLLMQFGYMAEKSIYKIKNEYTNKFNIKTLSQTEKQDNWSTIWDLTKAIIDHLRKGPVYYPGDEFTEEVYKKFYLAEDTYLHVAYDDNHKMIGIIETNGEENPYVKDTINVGEVYVVSEYRGSGLSMALLEYAASFEKQRGYKYLWVENGTANFNGREFWSSRFDAYQYELNRMIEIDW